MQWWVYEGSHVGVYVIGSMIGFKCWKKTCIIKVQFTFMESLD